MRDRVQIEHIHNPGHDSYCDLDHHDLHHNPRHLSNPFLFPSSSQDHLHANPMLLQNHLKQLQPLVMVVEVHVDAQLDHQMNQRQL